MCLQNKKGHKVREPRKFPFSSKVLLRPQWGPRRFCTWQKWNEIQGRNSKHGIQLGNSGQITGIPRFVHIKLELVVAQPWCYVICAILQVFFFFLKGFLMSFGGADFWSWVSCAKSWRLTELLAVICESGVVYKEQDPGLAVISESGVVHKEQNSPGPSIEPHWTPNMKGEEEAEIIQKIWSKPLECCRKDAKEFSDRKEELGDQQYQWSLQEPVRLRAVLRFCLLPYNYMHSIISKPLTTHQRVVLVLTCLAQYTNWKGLQSLWRYARGLCRMAFSRNFTQKW